MVGALFTFKRRFSRLAAEFVLIPVLAALATWLTGFVLAYRSSFGEISQYGLPLFWKTHLEYPGSVGRFGVVSPVSLTTYSLDVFVLDVLLYAGIAYSVVLWRQRHLSLFRNIVIPVSAGWLACATVLFSWSAEYGTWTNGLPIPWMGFWSVGWSYNWIGLASDAALIAAFESFAFFLYRGFKVIYMPSRGASPGPLSENLSELLASDT